jgi:glycerol-3-phosphate dehydrogenase
VVIFGGGVAGLWLLDEVVRRGRSAVLIEADALGSGQTVASQGIIHGGLKYTLQGLLTGSAAAVREMPLVWRECLAGRRRPDLSATPVRSACCYLWRTESVSSRLGMIGARFGLRVAPQSIPPAERPAVLAGCPGTVARLDEQVISPAGLVACLAAPHADRILYVDPAGMGFETSAPGEVRRIHLSSPAGETLALTADRVVFTAGAGNAELRRRVGLTDEAMQRRPLHMALLRGELPELNGHCVDGAKTRVTVTSDRDRQGRTVWQVGGHLAEWGVDQEPSAVLSAAESELKAVLPGLPLANVEGTTYRVDRAEGRTATGGRPETLQIRREGNVITAWPTKLVLAPRLAEDITAALPAPSTGATEPIPPDWPRPAVALPPWETASTWHRLDRLAQSRAA